MVVQIKFKRIHCLMANKYLGGSEMDIKDTLYNFRGLLDYSMETVEEREGIIEEICDDDFFVEYFDDMFNVHLAQDDELSSFSPTCMFLDSLASYLLMSKDVDEILDANNYNKFFASEASFKKSSKRMMSIEGIMESTGVGNISEVRFVDSSMPVNKKNYKKAIKQIITKKDLIEDSYCGDVLRQYNTFLDICKTQKDKGLSKFIVDKMVGSIKQDALYTKDSLKGTIQFKSIINGTSADVDFGDLDYGDEEVLKNLLSLNRANYEECLDGYLGCIMIDLDILVDNTELSDVARDTLQKRRDGWTLQEIADEEGISHVGVLLRIKKAIKKISENYKKSIDR